MDWITGLNLFISHSIQSNVVNLVTATTSLYATSFYCMLGNVYEFTMHKLHRLMCTNSWCTHSELKAPSDYSKRKRAPKVLTKAYFPINNVLPERDGKRWCQLLYWLVVTRLCNAHNLVECKYAWSARVL